MIAHVGEHILTIALEPRHLTLAWEHQADGYPDYYPEYVTRFRILQFRWWPAWSSEAMGWVAPGVSWFSAHVDHRE